MTTIRISGKAEDLRLAEEAVAALVAERQVLAAEIVIRQEQLKRAQWRMTALTASLCAIQLSIGAMQ